MPSISMLVAELESEGLITPTQKDQLIEDLCRTPPQLWPAVVDTFRAVAELRRQRSAVADSPSATDRNPVNPVGLKSSTGEPPGTVQPAGYLDPGQTALAAGSARAEEDSSSEAAKVPEPGNVPRAAATAVTPGPQVNVNLSRASYQGNAQSVEVAVTDLPEGGVRAQQVSFHGLPLTWESHVREAIKAIQAMPQRGQADEIRLRLLQLAASQRDGAVQPIPGLSPALQEFWAETLFGLALLQDAELNPDQQMRLAEARRHIQDGLRRLSEECPLEVTGLAFVTSVQSWGVYEGFDKYEFVPGQKVLLYAEVENLSAEATPKGYRTAWRSGYQILDSSGKQIAQYEYAPNEEYCRRPRRDFFIGCELSLPADAPPGRYVLRLTVVDLIKNRVGQNTIDFSLKSK